MYNISIFLCHGGIRVVCLFSFLSFFKLFFFVVCLVFNVACVIEVSILGSSVYSDVYFKHNRDGNTIVMKSMDQ